MRIRSIELETPRKAAAVGFLKDAWGLLDAGTRNATSYLRGTEDLAHVISVTEAATSGVGAVTFSGTAAELEQVRTRASAAGVRLGPLHTLDADTEVREAKDRVRAALQNARFEFPMRRITVNLAPADLPKESGRFDLPIALGILAAALCFLIILAAIAWGIYEVYKIGHPAAK